MAKETGRNSRKKSKESGEINPGEIAEVIAIEGKMAPEEEKKKKKDKKDNKDRKKKGRKKGKKQKKTILKEHTAFENIDEKKSKNRQAVWVKKSTLKYEEELHRMQIELSKWQQYVIENDQRFLLIFEGRDAAGKGGTIKRVLEYLNPRGTRVVALLKPSDREKTQWYFQRYIQQLPAGGEIVLFDRSWYNRAMVEPTMGFCTDEEHKRFLKDVPMIEEILVKNGIRLFKFFFSIAKDEQKQRFASRMKDPLKQYKISPVDRAAQEKWDDYTVRKFQMLNETNRTISPWTIIRADNKKKARLNCIKHILSKVVYDDKISPEDLQVDPEVVVSGIEEIKYMEDYLMTGLELPG